MMAASTFHRRILNAPAVSFSSPEGRALFESSQRRGFLESYFRLAEHFTTQSDPAFCGLGSLSMALNTLNVDPKRVWKGAWRWFDDSMLDCCVSLEIVKQIGIVLPKLACLAQCNGADVTLHFATDITEQAFREDVSAVCSDRSGEFVIIASYSRKGLRQTGDGHFSPIGAYDPDTDSVLILDVARFKYPPHWVPLPALFAAMHALDEATGRSRGYLRIRRADDTDATNCAGTCKVTEKEFSVGELKTDASGCCSEEIECKFCHDYNV